jgi:DNA-binding GntR family transcriptional regulator
MTARLSKAATRPVRRLPKRGTGHRYQAIARLLTDAITSGRYPVGSTLPTEHELCEKFEISRFTVREALRQLREAGLVTRRPRSGTTVIAAEGRSPFVQSLGSLDDLLQYAATTELRLLHTKKIEIDSSITRQIPIPAGQRWLFGLGIRFRREGNQPAALTRVYINPAFSDIAPRLKDRTSAIYRLIETHYDVVVTRVEQRIFAASLSRDDARQLQAKIGSPALRLIRLYYDKDGRLVTASDSLHPADRFSYVMTINKSDIGQ